MHSPLRASQHRIVLSSDAEKSLRPSREMTSARTAPVWPAPPGVGAGFRHGEREQGFRREKHPARAATPENILRHSPSSVLQLLMVWSSEPAEEAPGLRMHQGWSVAAFKNSKHTPPLQCRTREQHLPRPGQREAPHGHLVPSVHGRARPVGRPPNSDREVIGPRVDPPAVPAHGEGPHGPAQGRGERGGRRRRSGSGAERLPRSCAGARGWEATESDLPGGRRAVLRRGSWRSASAPRVPLQRLHARAVPHPHCAVLARRVEHLPRAGRCAQHLVVKRTGSAETPACRGAARGREGRRAALAAALAAPLR